MDGLGRISPALVVRLNPVAKICLSAPFVDWCKRDISESFVVTDQ